MRKTLIITNDFPPRRGGIEGFAKALADRLGGTDGRGVVVLTAQMRENTDAFDSNLPYDVIRHPVNTLLPTPAVKRQAVSLFQDTGCDSVLFASSVPLGILSAPLRRAGARRIVAMTHGHEVWYARLPFARQFLSRVASQLDTLTAVSQWTKEAIGKSMPADVRARMAILSPGVDPDVFHPGVGGIEIRKRLNIGLDVPVVVCPARTVPAKGQDKLIDAWRTVRMAVPDAVLVIVGDGKALPRLKKQAAASSSEGAIKFTGSVPWHDVAKFMDAADVVAMPSRSRLFGLGPEGFPLVFMEAAAVGKPVLVGRNGGAPEGTLDSISGVVVNPHDVPEIAARLIHLLQNRSVAREMGRLGREWVLAVHTWDQVAALADALLAS
jgi:phosphatidylinositol alpha-1,6-mannosyltransferase